MENEVEGLKVFGAPADVSRPKSSCSFAVLLKFELCHLGEIWGAKGETG